MSLGTSGDQRLRTLIGASEADHLMARIDEFRNDRGADEARARQ